MSELIINSVSGNTLPYDVYICDVYGNQCILVATINTNIPSSVTLPLPEEFDNAPSIGIKTIDSIGCEKFTINNCI